MELPPSRQLVSGSPFQHGRGVRRVSSGRVDLETSHPRHVRRPGIRPPQSHHRRPQPRDPPLAALPQVAQGLLDLPGALRSEDVQPVSVRVQEGRLAPPVHPRKSAVPVTPRLSERTRESRQLY